MLQYECVCARQVGVDVPEATIMVVQGAERFGLAQLHQMRGRVGRSTRASRCFLFTTPAGEARLRALEESNNGFDIALADLAYRCSTVPDQYSTEQVHAHPPLPWRMQD